MGITGIRSDYVYFRNNKKAYADWAAIETMLSQAQLTISDVDKINSITALIGNIAQNERVKELHSISNYFNKNKKELSLLKNGSRLMSMINNPPSDPKNLQAFYDDFIIAINLAKRDTEVALTRIKRLKENIDNSQKNIVTYDNDYRFSIGDDMTKLLKRLTGQYQINQIDDSSLSSQIQDIAIEAILASNLPERIKSGEDFASIASMILIDIEQIFQQRLDEMMKQNKDIKSFRDIADEVLPQIKAEYLASIKNNQPLTKIQSVIQETSTELAAAGMETAIRNATNILNIHTSSDLSVGAQRLQKLQATHDKNIREQSKEMETKLEQLRSRIFSNSELNESLFRIEFTKMDSGSAHGNLNELIEGLFGAKVRANVATDVITYTFGYKITQNNAKLDEMMHIISEDLSSIGDFLQTKQSQNTTLLTTLKNVNQKITEDINLLEQFLQNTAHIDEKLFIQHETLKLSKLSTKEGHGFKGRNMSIFSYIDYLASSLSGGNIAADIDSLKFLAYNIIPGAVAENEKGNLEKYFSMFAALLMFDDVGNMAQEAVNQVQSLSNNGQVEQLHLYNLNGLYVPSSMLLEYTYQGMQELSRMVESNYAAQAEIQISSKGANTHLSYTQRAQAAKSTKVQIIFLTGFTNIINRLFGIVE